ncbi:MAG: DUF4339 domain-containing protein [Proteobacteria bacterium]|nr:MAG: DUF4339 domain-containing protein [Pseudomonadota bacterium]
MLDVSRLFSTPPMLIESISEPGAYLIYRPDVGPDGFPIGSSLAVTENEYALVTTGSRIVNMLGPGIHTLDREALADLAALYSWPKDYDGDTYADVVFVSTTARARRVWRWRSAEELPGIEATGTVEVRVTDPHRFALSQIEKQRVNDDAVDRAVEGVIGRALRDLLSECRSAFDTLAADRREIGRRLQRRVRHDLGSEGIDEVLIRIRHIAEPRSQRATSSDEPAPTVSANNVTKLRFDNFAERVALDEEEPAPADVGDIQSLKAALEGFERDLETLDEWGSIRSRNDESAVEEVENHERRLPQPLRDKEFFIAVDMAQTGPLDATEFERAVLEGTVTRSTLIWHQGLKDWKFAGEIPEIATLF